MLCHLVLDDVRTATEEWIQALVTSMQVQEGKRLVLSCKLKQFRSRTVDTAHQVVLPVPQTNHAEATATSHISCTVDTKRKVTSLP